MCSMPFVISRARDAVSEHQSRALRVMESSDSTGRNLETAGLVEIEMGRFPFFSADRAEAVFQAVSQR